MLKNQALFRSTICGAALSVAAWLAPGSANALTIRNLSPEWVFVPGSITPNSGFWALPAILTDIGWGFENDPVCEPPGNWVLNTTITATTGYYEILEDDGSRSDIITVANTGPSGNGQIRFYS